MSVPQIELKHAMEHSFDWTNCPLELRPSFERALDSDNGALDLSASHLDDSHVPDIVNFLNAYPDITILNLNNNDIGNNGAKALANVATLKTLYINHNVIGNNGAKSLAGNKNIATLDISNNSLGRASRSAYFKTFKDNYNELFDYDYPDRLDYFCVTSPCLTASCCVTCPCQVCYCCCTGCYYSFDMLTTSPNSGAKALARNKTLSALFISENRVDNESVQSLIANTNIQFLDIRYNGINPGNIPVQSDFESKEQQEENFTITHSLPTFDAAFASSHPEIAPGHKSPVVTFRCSPTNVDTAAPTENIANSKQRKKYVLV